MSCDHPFAAAIHVHVTPQPARRHFRATWLTQLQQHHIGSAIIAMQC
jgi:hypothetical protein